jgi:hypothetical protein
MALNKLDSFRPLYPYPQSTVALQIPFTHNNHSYLLVSLDTNHCELYEVFREYVHVSPKSCLMISKKITLIQAVTFPKGLTHIIGVFFLDPSNHDHISRLVDNFKQNLDLCEQYTQYDT